MQTQEQETQETQETKQEQETQKWRCMLFTVLDAHDRSKTVTKPCPNCYIQQQCPCTCCKVRFTTYYEDKEVWNNPSSLVLSEEDLNIAAEWFSAETIKAAWPCINFENARDGNEHGDGYVVVGSDALMSDDCVEHFPCANCYGYGFPCMTCFNSELCYSDRVELMTYDAFKNIACGQWPVIYDEFCKLTRGEHQAILRQGLGQQEQEQEEEQQEQQEEQEEQEVA